MGRRRYPPLTPADVISIILQLGFLEKRQDGSHVQYERSADDVRPRALVTVDVAISTFGQDLIKSMIRQSGFTREQFYGATQRTRRKL